MRNTNIHPPGAHAGPSTGVDRWTVLSKPPSALSRGLPQEVWSQQLFLFCMNSTCGTVNRVYLWDSVSNRFLDQIVFFLKTWKPGVHDTGMVAVRRRQWSTRIDVSRLSKCLWQSCWFVQEGVQVSAHRKLMCTMTVRGRVTGKGLGRWENATAKNQVRQVGSGSPGALWGLAARPLALRGSLRMGEQEGLLP